MLTEIGTPANTTSITRDDLTGMVTALKCLHNAGKTHGDARLPNFVKIGTVWKLIDFRIFRTGSSQAKTIDFIQLYKSMNAMNAADAINKNHSIIISNFVSSNLSIDDIVTSLWNMYRFK